MKVLCSFVLGFILFQSPLWSAEQKKTNICLVLVVKDDEEVIQICLASATGITDCLCVCDAGSTDQTLEIIDQFFRPLLFRSRFDDKQGECLPCPDFCLGNSEGIPHRTWAEVRK